jgi:NADH-quinone oxidoreductase subunit H
VWLWLKTAAVMALTVAAGHAVARATPSRMLTWLWIGALPLSFLHLLWAGGLALWG